ncbi:MAG TPA: hypothetical protein DCW83_02100 [Saprospirales bacterium]|jgi:hypothetical protein|nr:hypothetical protein [Saprospirales bacterium]
MNTNFLSPIGFTVNVKRLPNVEFYTQRMQVPGVSAGAAETPNPLSTLYNTPDKLLYQELDLSFIVDENMANYFECLDWIEAITSPVELAQFGRLAKTDDGIVSDISITILNSHKNPNISFTFLNCFPVSLSQITLDVTQSDIQYPEASMVFRYDRFTHTKIG